MKRALIITYYWPPAGGAGVQRWLKFSRYLPENGWTPVIYTPSNPEYPVIDSSLEADIADDLEVIRRPITEPYKLYKIFTGRRNEAIKPGFITDNSGKSWKEKLSVWIRGNLFIPDPRIFWVRPSVKYLIKYLKENPADVIITSGPPHSMHLIGLALRKKLKVKWVADFRDPWTGIDYYNDLLLTKRSNRKHQRLEKEVLINADAVITVGTGCSRNLNSAGNVPITVIHNGFDKADMDLKVDNDTSKFSIVHTGALNRDRNPHSFWTAVRNLSDSNPRFKELCEVRLAGLVDSSVWDSIEKSGIPENVKHLGYLSHAESIAELKKASVLLLPVNRTAGSSMIVTGKVFEYMAAHRPILCICDPKSDIIEMVRKGAYSGCFDFDEIGSIEAYLRTRFESFLIGESAEEERDNSIYSRENLTKQLAGLLDDLTG